MHRFRIKLAARKTYNW